MRRFVVVLLVCVLLGCYRASVKNVVATEKEAPPAVVAAKERHPLIGVWCPWRVKEKEFGLPPQINLQRQGETKEDYERRKKNEESSSQRLLERSGFAHAYLYFFPNGTYQIGPAGIQPDEWFDMGPGRVCVRPRGMLVVLYRWKIEGDILTLTIPAEPRPWGKWSEETAQTYKRLH